MGAPPFTLSNASTHQTTPTYDGSGQVVHPSIIKFIPKILPNDFQFFLGITPYPNGLDDLENTSILFSKDGQVWSPNGVSNPIEGKTPTYWHNCDPCVLYALGKFWVYWILSKDNVRRTILRVKTSENAINYGARKDCLESAFIVSPSILYDVDAKRFKMWYINVPVPRTYNPEYRESEDGFNFGKAQPVSLTQAGRKIWHLDVQKLSNGKYWMLFVNHYSETSKCLWFADSNDGKNWQTYDLPVLSPSGVGWDSSQIYKSTFIVEDSKIKVWYTAHRNNVWHQGYTQANVNLPNEVYSLNIQRRRYRL